MNIAQLQGFVYTAQTGSITQGAKQAFVSQPAMTKMIQELEKELGVPLFDRVGRGIQINDQGRAFLNYVEAGLDQIQMGVEAVSKPIIKKRPIRLLVEVASALIPDIITTIHQIYPESPIQLTQRIAAVNETREFDFTISTHQPRPDRRSVPLLTEEIMIGSMDPSLTSGGLITPDTLSKQPIVSLDLHTPLRDTMETYFKKTRLESQLPIRIRRPCQHSCHVVHWCGCWFYPFSHLGCDWEIFKPRSSYPRPTLPHDLSH
ncbi:LysR family transcriptional regulator [Lacticaseibacillus manihotivorans]|uniref:LysR family transcriptional regulator n=1 Tax=Lacticaseibacillus manihotivorans TaxID=88233 RepID=UPI0006D1B246|nr:LysR family transcriptional regulator [Lacticaseibacillus manihotivorans]